MLPAKLAALCLCPALVATPAVIATQPKVRHAVAHLLHHAADRLEAPAAILPKQLAASPCAPGAGLASLEASPPAPMALLMTSSLESAAFGIDALPNAPSGSRDLQGSSWSAGIGGTGNPAVGIAGVGAAGGLGESARGGVGVMTPTPVAGVTEPQSWALLVTGFGGVGTLLRARRFSAA